MLQTYKHHKILLNFLLFTVFLLWNFYQPLTADDYGFTYFLNSQHQLLQEIITYNYLNWTGRISAVILVHLLLGSPHLTLSVFIINLLNSIISVIILNLIYKLIFGQEYTNLRFWVMSIIFITYYVTIGTFSQDFLWKTVTIQYLYGFSLLLFVLWRFYHGLNRKTSYIGLIVYSLAAIFIGFYSEIDIGFICSVYLSTVILWVLFKKPWQQLFKLRYFVFIISLLIAGAVSIMAPGNYIRQATYLSHLHNEHFNIFTKLAMTYVQFFRYGYHTALALLLIWVGVWVYKNRKILPQNTVESFSFLLLLLNINILSFVGIAYYSPISGRMLLIMDSLIFIILYRFFIIRFNLLNSNSKLLQYKSWFLGFSIILFAIISIAYYQLHRFILHRESVIDTSYISNKNLMLPALDINPISRYIIYFDTMRTSDSDFIKLYLNAKTN